MTGSNDCPSEILSQIFYLALTKVNPNCDDIIWTNDHHSALLPTQLSYEPYPFDPFVDIMIIGGPRKHQDRSTTRMRAQIRQVCKYWRNVVDGDPYLWTEATFDGRQPLTSFKHSIASSFPLLITVNIEFPNQPAHKPPIPITHNESPAIAMTACAAILGVLAKARHRITELEISSTCSVEMTAISSYFNTLIKGRHLRSLGIHQMKECNTGDSWKVPPLDLEQEIPSLVDLRLSCMPFKVTTSPLILTHITSFDLHFDYQTASMSGRWKTLKTLFSSAPNLENLRITLSKNPRVAFPFHGINLPKLTHLTLTLTETQHANLILPSFYSTKITFLSVSYRNSFMPDDSAAQAFYHLMLPVSIGIHAPAISRLTTLVISWHTINNFAIIVIAHQLKALENLVLHNMGSPIAGPSKLLAYLLDSTISVEMACRKAPVDGYCNLCCPNLRRVETHATDRRGDNYFAHARRRIGLPITLRGHYI